MLKYIEFYTTKCEYLRLQHTAMKERLLSTAVALYFQGSCSKEVVFHNRKTRCDSCSDKLGNYKYSNCHASEKS